MHSKIRFSMGQFTQKYAIVQFFEDIEEGYVYSSNNWPLHSTVVDTFAIKWSIDEMVVKLTEALKHYATVILRLVMIDFLAKTDKFRWYSWVERKV